MWLAGLVTSTIGSVIGILLGVGGTTQDLLEVGISAELLFWVALPSQFFGMLLALAWVSQRRGSGNFTKDFGLSIHIRDIGYLFLGMVLLVALGLALTPIAEYFGSDQTPQVTTEAVAQSTDLPTQLVIVLLLAVATPVVEELTFRGLLLRYLEERMTARRALWVSAALFGLFHALGVTGPAGAVLAIVQTFLAGLVLGYVTQRSGRLSRAIFVHGGFNLITVLILFFAPDLGI